MENLSSKIIYQPKDLIQILNHNLVTSSVLVSGASFYIPVYDSRIIINGLYSIFFAFSSKTGNGNDFIEDAYNQGVKNFIVTQLPENLINYDANFFQVKDVLMALQGWASFHRDKFNIPVIGITGSYGKTILKEWIFQSFSQLSEFQIYKSPLSYNSQIGVALSILGLEPQHQLAIIEAGISLPGEMEKLEKMIKPTFGIFTNIGNAHLQNFSSQEVLIQEKLVLFKNVEQLLFPSEFENLNTEIKKFEFNKSPNFITLGNKENDTFKSNYFEENNQTRIQINSDFYYTSFKDKASLDNLSLCTSFLLANKFKSEDINKELKNLHSIELRLEIKKGKNNCTIINDAYIMDVDSLKMAVQLLMQQNQHKEKIAILSDFENENSIDISNLIKSSNLEKVFLLGNFNSTFIEGFNPLDTIVSTFQTMENLLAELKINPIKDSAILIKGKRKFRMELVADFLSEKQHRTRLEVNLNSLVHNFKQFKGIISPNTKILVMVKALSYGAGSFEIASALQSQRVDYFGVAYVDEGIILREGGIKTPILVLNPEPATLSDLIDYELIPEIYSFKLLNSFMETCSIKKLNKPYPIHLKIDTGMHRLGFLSNEINKLVEVLKSNLNLIKVEGIFSHLVGSENPEMKELTIKQINNFKLISSEIETQLGIESIKHILNTAGIINYYEIGQLNMVRLGIGLYGINPVPKAKIELEEISGLKSFISQIHTIPKGEGIGYNWADILQKDSRIATVEIGYADGIRRVLGKGNFSFKVRDRECPTIGNICMDMCMIDVSNYPEIQEGDEVLIFGNEKSVEEFAKQCNTISYEVLTSISERVKRIYIKE